MNRDLEFGDVPKKIHDLQARLRAAEAVIGVLKGMGHPEWCDWSCFGGDENKTCSCWVGLIHHYEEGDSVIISGHIEEMNDDA